MHPSEANHDSCVRVGVKRRLAEASSLGDPAGSDVVDCHIAGDVHDALVLGVEQQQSQRPGRDSAAAVLGACPVAHRERTVVVATDLTAAEERPRTTISDCERPRRAVMSPVLRPGAERSQDRLGSGPLRPPTELPCRLLVLARQVIIDVFEALAGQHNLVVLVAAASRTATPPPDALTRIVTPRHGTIHLSPTSDYAGCRRARGRLRERLGEANHASFVPRHHLSKVRADAGVAGPMSAKLLVETVTRRGRHNRTTAGRAA